MFNQIRRRACVMAIVLTGACSPVESSSASGQEVETIPPRQTSPVDARTIKIVDAAKSFLASLSSGQREAALFAFTDREQRARWSNLPEGIFEREGVRWGDLTSAQRAAFRNLLGSILSPRGLKMVEQQMAADDVLKRAGSAAAMTDWVSGIRRGSDYYYVSLVGEPSLSAPWTLQFGGHHLAINATVVGPNVTLSPTLTGGQPVRFTLNGEQVDIVGDEVDRAVRLFDSLTDEQRRKAVISTRRIDLVGGPGRDGRTVGPEGLPGREMTPAQRTRLTDLIEARLGILNADDLAPRMAEVRSDLDRTYFAWFGPRPGAGAAYWRVTGPRLLMEFAPQSLGGDPSNHLHNIYRDPTNEYGARWAALD